MKKVFFTILITLITFQSYSQELKRFYVDETYKEITFQKFNKKLESQLFFTVTAINDTAIVKKLRFKEFFGHLGIKKKQLNKLFAKRFDIDSTKIWLIHYMDSLPDVTKMAKKSGVVYIDSSKRRHKHVMSYLDYRKIIPRETKKYRNLKKVSLLHFYNFNKGYLQKDIELEKWYKDSNLILKSIFTDGMKMYKTIVIHPNGKFYVRIVRKLFSEERKLLKYESFNRQEKKWRKKLERYN
jgi:hypothetical protein